MYISVGTRGARAPPPPSFQSVPYISCTTNEILHTVPPQSKSLSYASDILLSPCAVTSGKCILCRIFTVGFATRNQ